MFVTGMSRAKLWPILNASAISTEELILWFPTWISEMLDDLLLLHELSLFISFHVSRGFPLLISKLSQKYRFLASLIALFA